MGLLDILFPKRCVRCRKFGGYLCESCFAFISFDTKPFCLACNKASIDGLTHPGCRGRYVIDGCFSSIAYKGVVKKLLYSFKYRPYLSDLQTVLGELFYEGIIQDETFYSVFTKECIFVPIPLYSAKHRQRGYNQVLLLANGLAQRMGAPVAPFLVRDRMTRSQFGLKREERITNVAQAFSVPMKQDLDQKKVIFLIDDIVTSGATLVEAARVLKRAGYLKVYGLTLAHGS